MLIGRLQIHWHKNPARWMLDFERVWYEGVGDQEDYIGLTVIELGPIAFGWHHWPPE